MSARGFIVFQQQNRKRIYGFSKAFVAASIVVLQKAAQSLVRVCSTDVYHKTNPIPKLWL